MTKAELMEWIESANYNHDESQSGYDDNGSFHDTRIYEKDGSFYKIEFCNGHPLEAYGVKGYIRGEYQPVKVKRIETQVIQVTWEEI